MESLGAACDLLVAACGMSFPDWRLNAGSLHWECGVSAPGPPGKSVSDSCLLLFMCLCSPLPHCARATHRLPPSTEFLASWPTPTVLSELQSPELSASRGTTHLSGTCHHDLLCLSLTEAPRCGRQTCPTESWPI